MFWANAMQNKIAKYRQVNIWIIIPEYLWLTQAKRLVLSMKQQAGAAQLCLNVKSSTFLPGGHKIQDVRVRTQPFVVPGFLHTAVPLTVPPEAMSRTFDSILAAIRVALHLKKKKAATLLLHNQASIVTLSMQLRGLLKGIIFYSALWWNCCYGENSNWLIIN